MPGPQKPACNRPASCRYTPSVMKIITRYVLSELLQVFLVVSVAYGFATLALLIPSIAAFDLLTGRSE